MGAVKEDMYERLDRVARGTGRDGEELVEEWYKQKEKGGFEEFLAGKTKKKKRTKK